jgi:hypothetical protein
MKILKLLLVCIIIYSCGGPRAVYDYDEQVNYSTYNSIGIYPDIRSGLSELDQRRLLNSVNEALEEKGMLATTMPDLYLNIYSESYQEPSRSSVGVGIGGTGRNVGVGVSGGIPIGGPENFLRLTFDLVDVRTDELVWQAVVDSKFDLNSSPEERQKKFDKIVDEALEGYPPKK